MCVYMCVKKHVCVRKNEIKCEHRESLRDISKA